MVCIIKKIGWLTTKVIQPIDALKRRGMRLLFPDEFLQTTGDILVTGAYRIFTAY